MTPWDRLRGRVTDILSNQDRRRWVLLVAIALIVVLLIAATTPWWLIWPVLAVIWLVAIGAVAYVAVRLAMRRR